MYRIHGLHSHGGLALSIGCQCLTAGQCPRYGVRMSPRKHHLCKTDDRYRNLFEMKWGVHATPPVDPTPIPPCVHRGDEIATLKTPFGGLPVLSCSLHVETHAGKCASCNDATTVKPVPKIEAVLPAPTRHGPKIKQWAVGITTAPRREETFARTMRSLISAGWESPRIFAEPDSPITSEFEHLPITQRTDKAGAFPNFYLGLQELLQRHPGANAFMMVQDDILFTERDGEKSLREYLESALWPEEKTGAVSLYTSLAYAKDSPGWHLFHPYDAGDGKKHGWVWGACCFIWPRESLISFLTTNAIWWRINGPEKKKDHPNPATRGMRNIDTLIGKWAVQQGKSIWYPSPSLVQHVGETSAMWGTGQHATRKRKARDFAGDLLK